MMQFSYVVLSFLVLSSVSMADQQDAKAGAANGAMIAKKVKVKIQSCAAFWDKKQGRQFTIYLFPFVATGKDVQRIKKRGMKRYIAGVPSPDKSKWNKCPYITVRLTMRKDRKDYSAASVESCSVTANNFFRGNKHWTWRSMKNDNVVKYLDNKLDLDVSEPRIRFRLWYVGSGDPTISGTWQIAVSAKVHEFGP